MAIIKCPECSKEISDKATACPGCGCPIAGPQKINVSVNQNQERHQFYNELPEGMRLKETFLSTLAECIALFPVIGYIGLALAILDIKLDTRYQYSHRKDRVAIGISIFWTCVILLVCCSSLASYH